MVLYSLVTFGICIAFYFFPNKSVITTSNDRNDLSISFYKLLYEHQKIRAYRRENIHKKNKRTGLFIREARVRMELFVFALSRRYGGKLQIQLPQLQEATRSYKELQGATRSYKELQGATRSYRELLGATRRYKELQRTTRTYKKLYLISYSFSLFSVQ